MSGEEADPPIVDTRGRSYPLNSRRLTASMIGRIASELGVPMGGSLEDTRQMLEGKLVEAGREPRNVQVVFTEADEGATVRLEDENGFFMEVLPAEEDVEGGDSRENETEDGEDHAPLIDDEEPSGEELRTANAQIGALKNEVSVMKVQLERLSEQLESERGELTKERGQLANAKAKYKELWSVYCSRSARDDALKHRKMKNSRS